MKAKLMALPKFTMSELLEAGVHFGHRTFRWNPQIQNYIFGQRNGVHIIDLTQTVPMMYSALAAVEQAVARGGRVLFVGTKKQAQEPIREYAERCGMYHMTHRWLGGTLTNWKTIGNSIRRLKKLEVDFNASREAHAEMEKRKAAATEEAPATFTDIKDPLSHLNKKERLMLTREYDKLNLALGGIKDMNGLPDIVVVLDVKKEAIAVNEANCLGIPVIGIIDSNSSDAGIAYPIPGNDDSTRALNLYSRLVSDAVLSGIALQAQSAGAGRGASSAPSIKANKPAAAKVTLSPKAQAVAKEDAAAAAKPAAPEAKPEAVAAQ